MTPKGQSLQEYALPVGLVALVCIGSLGVFGQQLLGGLNGAWSFSATPGRTTASPPLVAAVPTETNNTPQVTFSNPTPGSSFQVSPAGLSALRDLEITLQDGSKAKISGFPADVPGLVETEGVDGATRQLALSLQQLADQLEKDGKISYTDASYIRSMGTHGFALADQHGTFLSKMNEQDTFSTKGNVSDPLGGANLESYINNTGYGLQMGSHTVSSDVITQRQQELASGAFAQGLQAYLDNPYHASGTLNEQYGGSIPNILDLYTQLAQNGQALKDPALKKVIDTALTQMATINASNATEMIKVFYTQPRESGQLGFVAEKEVPTGNTTYLTYQITAEETSRLKAQVAEAMHTTKGNSQTICAAGNGDGSSGVRCEAAAAVATSVP